MIVSYDRSTLGQSGTGHFSPIAAYHAKSDSTLVLDTARFKYSPYFVKISDLYEAMLPIDPDTSRSRGVLLVAPKSKKKMAA